MGFHPLFTQSHLEKELQSCECEFIGLSLINAELLSVKKVVPFVHVLALELPQLSI